MLHVPFVSKTLLKQNEENINKNNTLFIECITTELSVTDKNNILNSMRRNHNKKL